MSERSDTLQAIIYELQEATTASVVAAAKEIAFYGYISYCYEEIMTWDDVAEIIKNTDDPVDIWKMIHKCEADISDNYFGRTRQGILCSYSDAQARTEAMHIVLDYLKELTDYELGLILELLQN